MVKIPKIDSSVKNCTGNGMAEERGLGIKSLKTGAEKRGLPLPKYSWDNPYLTLTLYRSAAGAASALSPEVLDCLNTDEQKGWEFLTTKMSVTRKEYADQMGFDNRKAQLQLSGSRFNSLITEAR